jgi:hypothetical protein
MDPKITQEILDDLIPSLEALETKSTAVLEFLKHEGLASDEKLAPYLEQAANASNVRWLGVRVRVERLLSKAEKDSSEKQTDKEEKKREPEPAKASESNQSDSEVGDNSKSAGPENQSQIADKDKKTEAMGEDTGSKLNASNEPTGKDNNGDHPQASDDKSKSPVASEEQKVA